MVDPRRDCLVYLQRAQQECSEIRYILETHRNEDYVIGSRELQSMTTADIAHSRESPFKYGEHNLGDGDLLDIGRLKIKVLYTPGHTNDSLCYVVSEGHERKSPLLVFTGDTLFVGDVGRTDLVNLDSWQEQTERLFDSLHRKLLPLGDHVTILPSHGSGSICGHEISDREFSTIGYERKTNPMLQLDKPSFIQNILKQRLTRPPYFRKMEEYNLEGPPLLKEATEPRILRVTDFEAEMHNPQTIVIDTRTPSAFAGSNIPDSLNIWLDGLSFFPGWVLTYDQNLLLITERREDVELAKTYLRRLGFDNVVGYLCLGLEEWRNQGKSIQHLDTLSATMLKKRSDRNEIRIIDVRGPHEWEGGYIAGAERIYVGDLPAKINNLSRDKPIACICSVGYRGGLGASILKKNGFKAVYNVLGGIQAWKQLGYPLEKE